MLIIESVERDPSFIRAAHGLVSGIGVKTNHSGLALVVARSGKWRDPGCELLLGHSRRQLVRLEIGRYQYERIMPRRLVRRHARTGKVADALPALAADIFGRILAHFTFGTA